MACLHALPTCTSCLHLTTLASHIASPTYDAGRPALTRLSAAIVALQLARATAHARQTDLHAHVGCGRRQAWYRLAREAVRAGGPDYRRKELDAGAGNPSLDNVT
jgi:hypothetical protein